MPLCDQSSPNGEIAIGAAPASDPCLDAEEAKVSAREVRANF
jgi:hypothetical protein